MHFFEESLLDGYYVIKSNVPEEDADTQKLHDHGFLWSVSSPNLRFSSMCNPSKFRKYSVYAFISQFFNILLKFLSRGYTQISLIGTLIFPGGPSFPRPLVSPTLIQLAAL